MSRRWNCLLFCFLLLITCSGLLCGCGGSSGSMDEVNFNGKVANFQESANPNPVVMSISNASGSKTYSPGDECIIRGYNFGSEGNGYVKFTDTGEAGESQKSSTYSLWNDEEIRCIIPSVSEEQEYSVQVGVIFADGTTAENFDQSDKSHIVISGSSGGGKVYAIFIGINAYQNFTQLRYCINDANGLKDSLSSSPLWSEANVVTLYDSDATKNGIHDSISNMAGQIPSDGIFYFSYSGHGSNDGTLSYICPVESTSSTSSLISDEELYSWLSLLPDESEKYMILDSCFSGGFIGKDGSRTARFQPIQGSVSNFSGDRLIRQLQNLGNSEILAASRESELSYEDSALSHGVFSYYLIEGFGSGSSMGPADIDGSGSISATESYNYANPLTQAFTTNAQNPQIQDTHPGDLIIKQ